MMKTKIFYFFVATLMLTACDNIEESERLIYEAPPTANRAVLIEDFTGQQCVNCPTAADTIHSLQQRYGDSVVIAVAIHGGAMSVKPNPAKPKVVGLATDLGDYYHNHWKVETWPMGMVSRGNVSRFAEWEAQVREEIQKKAPVNLSATFTDKDGKVTVETTYMGAIGHTDAKLQVWVVEDSITAIQKMPDGSYNSQYIHRHVFRGAVNGDWGTDISIDEGEKKTDKFDVTIDDTWNRKQLSAVVFVYNDQGVLQVISKPLKQ
jgi:hypothetical protein